ncbi:hypothetical protein GCM10007989_34260 [Devosia pacifica]|uniref:DUF2147 domain-containing protein n=1 Tax=Devosia pacifica TaxID=1335967 RepID=A0A918VW78_9HYPH|nr:DUF2147 domain-containing protein [Devosia pacifica]GHA35459.1 hypothetical protein GCM10007989_34260 [Devosia pacifica]
MRLSPVRHFSTVAALTMGSFAAEAAAQAPVEGTWRTQLDAHITISACPEGYCGEISKIVIPDHILATPEGQAAQDIPLDAMTDMNNEDPGLRNRPILGLQILTVAPTDEAHIYDGEIYNPEDGKTYSGYLEVLGPDALRLNGCVMFNVICRGEAWERVEEAEGQQ